MTEQEQKAFDQMREAFKPFEKLLKQMDEVHPQPTNFDCQIAVRDLRALIYSFDNLTAANAVSVEPEPPSDENIADAWISASDSDGIAYDGPSFERGYRLGRGEYDEYTGALVAAAKTEAVQPQAQGEALLQKAMKLAVGNGWIPKTLPHDEYLSAWALMSEFLQEVAHPQATETAWRPIETAPKDGTRILVCKAKDVDGNPMGDSFGLFVQRAAWWEGEGWVVYCSLVHEPQCFFEPTHWMPLPAAPEAHHGK